MDTLQFQKAEYADSTPQCGACKAAITGEHFKLFATGHTLCPSCAAAIMAQQEDPSPKAVLRGVLFGAGAALACCIGYAAIIMITGLEIGLIAILVGYLVGTAVRKGSHGLGGIRSQIAAVVLTYVSITFSYIPMGIQQATKQAAVTQAKGAPAQPVQRAPVTAGNILLLVGILAGYAVITPFLGLASGISGILGFLILGLGLQRAWAITGRDERVVSGPFQIEGAASVD